MYSITNCNHYCFCTADALQQQGYYEMLQKLVEETQQTNNGSKVTLVAHSVGAPVTLYFLNHFVTQDWKDKHINAFVPLSGAWAGGNDGLALFVSEISVLNNLYLRYFTSSYRTTSSGAWLLPNSYAWGNEALILTPNKNYSANDFNEMFSDIGREEDYERFSLALSLNADYPPPNVPVFCYYGVNFSTPQSFTYGSGFPNDFIGTTHGDGDGVIHHVTSEICLGWARQKAPFESNTFPLSHNEMVSNDDVLEAVSTIVTATPSPTPPTSAASVAKYNIGLAIAGCFLTYQLITY